MDMVHCLEFYVVGLVRNCWCSSGKRDIEPSTLQIRLKKKKSQRFNLKGTLSMGFFNSRKNNFLISVFIAYFWETSHHLSMTF